MKYSELLLRNVELAPSAATQFRVAVLANITIAAIKEVCEFSLRSRGIGAVVTIGGYDNVAQDSTKYSDHDAVVVFYELAGIIDNLPFQLHRIDSVGIDALIAKAKSELSFIFDSLAGVKLVVFNLLTAMPFTLGSGHATALDRICQEVNDFVRAHAPKSFKLVSLDKIFAQCSVRASVDLRFFLSSRALYQLQFLRTYCEFIQPLVAGIAGGYKKVLVLDCDNTLWKGVIGEDGLAGLQMFQEVQSLIVQLARAGILICLCSKNNPEDIEAALNDPRMILKDEHLIVKAVNWRDKADNLAQIAQTLNLGLESFVFLDDSDFELERVRQELPSVTSFKVPTTYPDYLWLWQSIGGLFYREADTAEDRVKTTQYRTEFARREQRAQFDNVDDYLSSLELRIKLTVNSPDLVPRLAQLTQKTNQFNLTTRRLTESELSAAVASTDYLVVGIDVSDRFGGYGTTGLIMISQTERRARIDNFLLSCRVLGRSVELKAFDCVIDMLQSRGVTQVEGTYRPTSKNAQVRNLYSRLGFSLIDDDEGVIRFCIDVDSYRRSGIGYIRVENA